MPKQSDNRLKCSFCGKSQDQVKKLIAGPGVYICDECVDLCNEILNEEIFHQSAVAANKLLTSPALAQEGHSSHDAPESALAVKMSNATLHQLRAMNLDDWRGSRGGAETDTAYNELIANALVSLEALLSHYDTHKMQGGVEPLYRAMLWLKEKSLGNTSEELLPILNDLSYFYTLREEYHLAASLLEWMLEIAHAKGTVKKEDQRTYVINLIKLYGKLGRNVEADLLLDSLYSDE